MFPSVQVRFVPRKQFLFIPFCALANKSRALLYQFLLEKLEVPPEEAVHHFFSVRSKTGSRLIVPDDVDVFDLVPELVFLPCHPDVTSEPATFYLQISRRKPNQDDQSFKVNVPVINPNGSFIYLAQIILRPHEYHIRGMTQFLRKIHNCGINAFSVMDLKGPVSSFIEPFPMISGLLHDQMFVTFSMSAEDEETIANRVKALDKLRETEKEYLGVLEGFDSHVRPIFSRIKFTPKELGDTLLSAVSHILNVHRQIYGELENLSIHFMTKIGKKFSEYIRFLGTYNSYIQAQKQVSTYVAKAMLLPALAPLFQELKESPYGAGHGLDSILLVPLRRSQAYTKLLQAVLSATPERHPDWDPLKQAIDVCREMLRKLAAEAAANEQFQRLRKLAALFEDNITVINPSRNLVNYYTVQSGRQKQTMIIFSDEFWVTRQGPTGRLVLPNKMKYAEIGVWPLTAQAILFRLKGNDVSYVFESAAQRDAFLTDFRGTSIANQQLARDQVQLETEAKSLSIPLALHCHSMVFCGDSLWVYGGIDEKGVTQGVIRRIPVVDFQVLVRSYCQATDPKPRFGAAACAVESLGRIYVFGGTDGKTIFNDFWAFDLATCLWKEIRSAQGPPACKGYVLKLASHEYLLLTGGSPKLAFFRFNLSMETWDVIQPDEKCEIGALVDPAVVPIPDSPGSVLIHGGKRDGDKPTDMMWKVDGFGKNCKCIKMAGLHPLNRAGNHAVYLNGFVYVFGGDIEYELPFALHLLSWTWVVPSQKIPIGQFPGAALAVGNGTIYLHGGTPAGGPVHSKMFIINPKHDKPVGPPGPINEVEQSSLFWKSWQDPDHITEEPWIDVKSGG